jgi:hypothetical protein
MQTARVLWVVEAVCCEVVAHNRLVEGGVSSEYDTTVGVQDVEGMQIHGFVHGAVDKTPFCTNDCNMFLSPQRQAKLVQAHNRLCHSCLRCSLMACTGLT